VFDTLLKNAKLKPAQQVQKYHKILFKGLANQTDIEIEGLSKLPVNRNVTKKIWINFTKEKYENVFVHYLPCINLPIVNNLIQMISSFFIILFTSKGTVVCLDVLNVSMGMGVRLACKIRKHKLIGIVTDLPEQLTGSVDSRFTIQCGKIIENCNGYLLLTEAMNDVINGNRAKPYVVIEGQVDSSMKLRENNLLNKYDKKVCMYTGNLNRIHGIEYLISGFLKAKIPDSELHIYGDGDYQEDIRNISNKHKNVKYFGVKMSSEVTVAQQKATLLINPRPTNQDFVKYSFPSKNMEYMVSGTPVLTTKLPGMPQEYNDYVYLINDETSEGLSNSLKCILNKPSEELHEKGLLAREFVLREKNENVQSAKLKALIEKWDNR